MAWAIDVVRGPVGVGAVTGAGVAEAPDGAVHEAGVALPQHLVAHAEPVETPARMFSTSASAVSTSPSRASLSSSDPRSRVMPRLLRL